MDTCHNVLKPRVAQAPRRERSVVCSNLRIGVVMLHGVGSPCGPFAELTSEPVVPRLEGLHHACPPSGGKVVLEYYGMSLDDSSFMTLLSLHHHHTVSASILGGFDFGRVAFT
eukprot:4699838-Prymnesium_polylepis.1